MDFQSSTVAAQTVAQPNPATTAPAAEADGRAVADSTAVKRDATPDVPLPVPPSPSQTGLVSAAALSKADAAPKLDASGVSAAERTLKPYGISMLPDRSEDDQTPQATLDDATDEVRA